MAVTTAIPRATVLLRWGRLRALLAVGLLLIGVAGASPAAEQRTKFDHLTTGFELIGQHRDLPCESCHADAIFKGTPRDCVSCHGGTQIRATAKPKNHILSSDRCEACHTPVAFNPAVSFDHAEARGSCSTCHNNVQAQGKGPGHVTTDLECDACHSTIGWAGAVFSHLGVTSGCTGCHNGVNATGTPANHIPIAGADCVSCHSAGNFSTFAMADTSPPMNHAVVAALACSTCHEAGRSFVGVPPVVTRPAFKASGAAHPPAGECSTCHFSTTSFKGATDYPANHIPVPSGASATCSACHSNPADYSLYTMNHAGAGISSGCAACHASGLSFINMAPPVLKQPPADHIPVGSAACESCHAAANFSTFAIANTVPPMNHAVVASTACSSCHEAGKSFVGAPPIVTRPALKASGQPHVTTGECSTCHFNTTSFKGATDYPSNHMPVPGGSTASCSVCHSNFADYSVYTMNHAGAGISSGCAACHASGLSFVNMAPPVLKQPPANHIPIGTAACESCHAASSFGTFAMANAVPPMNHAAVSTQACSACHAAGLSFVGTPPVVVAPANHIPIGTATCQSCHSATNFTSFAMANTAPPMNHAAVSAMACSACHAAGLSFVGTPPVVVAPANHIPIGTATCQSCHSATNFSTFVMPNTDASMNHTVVASTACSTCHEAGKSFVGTPAIVTRPALKPNGQAHVTTGECSTCHFNTTSFLGATDLPSNHIPLPAADNNVCTLCHTNASDYSVYTMNHVNISSNCAQCHASGLSFANMAPPVLKEPPTSPRAHIPFGSVACEQCHVATQFTTFAGTIMRHAAVRSMTCMSCHEFGMNWLTNTGVTLWVRDGPDHHPGQDCGGSGCHTARDKFLVSRPAAAAIQPGIKAGAGPAAAAPGPSLGNLALGRPAAFNHARALGSACVNCHGPAGGGQPAGHIATSNACEACHTTLYWLPVTQVDHTQVRGTCVSCHRTGVARAKPARHIASDNNCQNCHTTNAWTPARFDHGALTAGSCTTCHDSVHAIGMPANHVPTKQQCDNCHGTLAWRPARVDHTTLLSNCASCHNNVSATGMPITHMVTRRDCATCHRYADWTALVFSHSSAAYPGNHRITLACTACHTSNTDQVPYTAPAYAGSCGACHAKDFKPDLHLKTTGGAKYTAGDLADCTGACHVYTDATLSTVATGRPGPYHRVSDAAFRH